MRVIFSGGGLATVDPAVFCWYDDDGEVINYSIVPDISNPPDNVPQGNHDL